MMPISPRWVMLWRCSPANASWIASAGQQLWSPRLGRAGGVLSPHVPAPGAPVSTDRDDQGGGPPSQRLVRQPPDHRAAGRPLTPASTAPAVRFHDPTGQHRALRRQALAGHFKPELVEAAERGQIRGGEGSVRRFGPSPVRTECGDVTAVVERLGAVCSTATVTVAPLPGIAACEIAA
jgi:hypothetical protein